jgi:hypothetical protein
MTMKMTLISEERFKELEEAEAEVDDLKYDLEQTERENRILRKRLELKSRAQAQVSPMKTRAPVTSSSGTSRDEA